MTTSVISQSSAPIMELAFAPELLPDVEWAISKKYPVRCFYRPDFDKPWQADNTNCSQTPSVGAQGWIFGGRTLTSGESFKVKVPITVSKPKSGIADGAAATFYQVARDVNMFAGSVTAEQSLFVFPAKSKTSPTDPTSPSTTGRTLAVGSKTKLPKKQKIKGQKKKVTYQVKTRSTCKLVGKGKKVKALQVGTCKLKAKPKRGKGKKTITYQVV